MLDNKYMYIDNVVQKGEVPGVSGCVEHTIIHTQVIGEILNLSNQCSKDTMYYRKISG
jgi:hypothetical protein